MIKDADAIGLTFTKNVETDLEMPDLRSNKEESSLPEIPESFLCEDRGCRVERDKILAMAGISGGQDRINGLLKKMVDNTHSKQKRVAELQAEIDDDKNLVEDLLIALDYGNIKWDTEVEKNRLGEKYEELHVKAVRNGSDGAVKDSGYWGGRFRGSYTYS